MCLWLWQDFKALQTLTLQSKKLVWTLATDERIQVEMCFTHTALEYLIIVSEVFTEDIFIYTVK